MSIAITNKIIYCKIHQEDYLYAISAETGKTKWKFKIGNGDGSIIIVQGILYFFNKKSNYLYAISLKKMQRKIQKK